ncbi:hypothetical protein ACO0K3_19195 [Undibacterium sp. Rencai35W]|uniref:hypothetical protein n=1 Tax=Undibacterium sp. Rencai35W TaxID=3413046 RepID=UPI003BF37E3C
MSTTALELLEIMDLRLKMQKSGLTNPPSSIKAITQSLVDKLSALPVDEEIEILVLEKRIGRYIRSSTNEILAEIHFDENT